MKIIYYDLVTGLVREGENESIAPLVSEQARGVDRDKLKDY